MPVMDGWEFRKQQRADPQLCNIPVIITSACHNVVEQTVDLHPAAVLPKPLDFDALVRLVSEMSQPI